MNSTGLEQSLFVVGAATQTIPETESDRPSETGAEAAFTARAIVAVTLLSTGFWYLLWKIALHFEVVR